MKDLLGILSAGVFFLAGIPFALLGARLTEWYLSLGVLLMIAGGIPLILELIRYYRTNVLIESDEKGDDKDA